MANTIGDRLRSGICPQAVAKGYRCIYSDQGVWYLDHLDVPWQPVYNADPVEGITDPSEQKLVIGGQVCMWGETADTSDIQQTIWPRAAAAAGMHQCLSNLLASNVIITIEMSIKITITISERWREDGQQ